jgi:epoxide hydrolase-like predicted phosphatase
MIRAVIFDVGGVLVRTVGRENRKRWEKKLHLREWESEDIVFNSDMGIRAQLGQISSDSLWIWVGYRFELSAEELRRFRRDFWADNLVDSQATRLIEALRPAYQTAIISNATNTLRSDLSNRYNIAHLFDVAVISAEEKIMKPEAEIYWRALDRLQREPSECVFIDDAEVNVSAARKIGLQVIHYTKNTELTAELTRLGVKTGG